ncbi:MAG: glycosyltransferase [Alphaproteobacteria bacterium]|nr:glycosyltransferase [Alphaproteobacteria bacterium]
MAHSPIITLITPVFNAAATIEKTFQSVQAQTYPYIDYIVVDGGSTDGTVEIIERYRGIIRYFHSRPDRGPYDAVNQALALAQGEITGIVSADDWLAPDAVETVAALAEADKEAEIFCFALEEQRQTANGALRPARIFCDPEGERFRLFDGIYCQGLSRFYRTELMRRAGLFDGARYPKLADREWYMRVGLREPRKTRTPKTLYYFRCHPGSISGGGKMGGTVRSLQEMAQIARHYLREKPLSPLQREWVKNWYCFTMVRLVFYAARDGKLSEALRAFTETLRRYPARFALRVAAYKLPRGYRHRIP